MGVTSRAESVTGVTGIRETLESLLCKKVGRKVRPNAGSVRYSSL